jgi:hypothetical protein
MAGLSFAAASSLWQTVLATRIASQQLGTVAAADEASGAVANSLAIALTAPLVAILGARTIMAGGTNRPPSHPRPDALRASQRRCGRRQFLMNRR